jgi:hypothetical protein
MLKDVLEVDKELNPKEINRKIIISDKLLEM